MTALKRTTRRSFMGSGAAAAAALTVPLQPFLGGQESEAEASITPYNPARRVEQSYSYRAAMARMERIDVGVQMDNGDAVTFTDFSGNYSKALAHDALGVPNKASVETLLTALQSADASDFEKIITGTPEVAGAFGAVLSAIPAIDGIPDRAVPARGRDRIGAHRQEKRLSRESLASVPTLSDGPKKQHRPLAGQLH